MKQHSKVVAKYGDGSKKYLAICGKWFEQKYFERAPTCKKCLDPFKCKRQILSLKPPRKSKTNDPAAASQLVELPIAA